jgi:hypothetical protein
LVLQRAVEDEVTAFLGRARYQRTEAANGSRNGTRPKPVQTAEGEITIDMPQVRGAAERFISRVFPDSRTVIRTRSLEALIIGGYVRGLSDRDTESLMGEAGLGQVSESTASRICRELRARHTTFCARSLADVELLALFLDAIYLPTRPSGEKEGVLVAWGYTTQGKRVLRSVRLGQRERHEDWLDLGRDLVRRGLRSPWLVHQVSSRRLTSCGRRPIVNDVRSTVEARRVSLLHRVAPTASAATQPDCSTVSGNPVGDRGFESPVLSAKNYLLIAANAGFPSATGGPWFAGSNGPELGRSD